MENDSENCVSSLADDLEKPLPSKKRKLTEADIDDSEDEKEEVMEGDITSETKNKIYNLLSEITKEDIDKNKDLIAIIQKINGFNEGQALAYYDMLETCLNFKRNDTIARRLLKIVGDKCTHPLDGETGEAMVKDNFLISYITNILGRVFNKLGNISGVLILITYIFTSHYIYGRKRAITSPAFSNDGLRTEPNGENNPNGKITLQTMGQ